MVKAATDLVWDDREFLLLAPTHSVGHSTDTQILLAIPSADEFSRQDGRNSPEVTLLRSYGDAALTRVSPREP
jgi:hypothetical protein